MLKLISIKLSNKIVKLNVRKMNSFNKFIGLMFRTKDTKNLLFEFEKDTRIAIHSFFVFFSFLIIWLDKKNNIMDYKIVRPFCFGIRPLRSFRKIIEIPFNEKNKKIISIFDKLYSSLSS